MKRYFLIQVLFFLLNWSVVKYYVEKHSIHPKWSMPITETSLEVRCWPWDSC